MNTSPTTTFRSLLATCLVLAVVAAVAGYAQAQPSPKPFTKDDVVKLLTGNVPVKRVEVLVRERGIDFQITPDTESDLRKAGATDTLLAVLRELAPKPPTLVVTTNPGGAQVFVDDELIAKTSAGGRLKISNLAAGPHKLRVSLDGYRDHEESVDLVAGETLGVPIPLERNTETIPPATSSAGSGASSPRASSLGGKVLTLPGRLSYGSFQMHSGTMTVGNGRLRFSANQTKYSWESSLSNVVWRDIYRANVAFDVLVSGEKQHWSFSVYMGKNNAAGDIQAAKEFSDALKAGSK